MKMLVQKYGGSSVNSIEKIFTIVDKIIHNIKLGHKVVVVVSAAYGDTNKLYNLAHTITTQPNPRELDVLLACGEQTSIALLTMALHTKNIKACSFTGQQAGIITDGVYGRAQIINVNFVKFSEYFKEFSVIVVAGFQGISKNNGDITTLGRGGSDLTAVVLAHYLQAIECQIYGDVAGVYTADPYIIKNASLLPYIDGKFMIALMHMGAKVLQSQAAYYAYEHKVPLALYGSFTNSHGTKVIYDQDLDISSVSICKDLVAIVGENISFPDIEHIQLDNFYLVRARDLQYAINLLQPKNLSTIENLALISLVSHRLDLNLAKNIMDLCNKHKPSVLATSTKALKICWLVDDENSENVLNLVHKHINMEKDKIIM